MYLLTYDLNPPSLHRQSLAILLPSLSPCIYCWDQAEKNFLLETEKQKIFTLINYARFTGPSSYCQAQGLI